METTTPTTSTQFCTFYLGDLFFGIKVQEVQEVIRYQEMTRVPLAPALIGGLINLRGEIVTAIDLRRRLQLPPRQPEKRPMNVVVRTPDGPVSLLVDEIGDVQLLTNTMFERTPDTLQGSFRNMIYGTYKLKDQLLLVLDAEKVVHEEQAA